MDESTLRALIQRLIDGCSLPPGAADALLQNILLALTKPPDAPS